MFNNVYIYFYEHIILYKLKKIWEIINGALVLLKNYNGTQLHFSGTPQLYANYNRDTINQFSVKLPLNLE